MLTTSEYYKKINNFEIYNVIFITVISFLFTFITLHILGYFWTFTILDSIIIQLIEFFLVDTLLLCVFYGFLLPEIDFRYEYAKKDYNDNKIDWDLYKNNKKYKNNIDNFHNFTQSKKSIEQIIRVNE